MSTIGAAGDVALGFDYDGPLVTRVAWAGDVAGSVAYDYDDDLKVIAENGTNFLYDDDGLLTAAGMLSLRRNAQNGMLTGSTLGSIVDSYSYNEYGEVVAYSAAYGETGLLQMDYGRDAIGRITSTTETVGGTARPASGFVYDDAGRLEAVTQGGATVAEYDYDANSNRTAHRFVGGASSATYDAQDRLLTYDDATYAYAANGELTSRTVGGVTTTFDYDALGNLRTVAMRPGCRSSM